MPSVFRTGEMAVSPTPRKLYTKKGSPPFKERAIDPRSLGKAADDVDDVLDIAIDREGHRMVVAGDEIRRAAR